MRDNIVNGFLAVFLLIAFGLHWVRAPHHPAPPPAQATAASGPQCTPAYPRGFQFTKRDRKHPTCETMHIMDIAWGRCTRRIDV